jgi:hypothetical protein
MYSHALNTDCIWLPDENDTILFLTWLNWRKPFVLGTKDRSSVIHIKKKTHRSQKEEKRHILVRHTDGTVTISIIFFVGVYWAHGYRAHRGPCTYNLSTQFRVLVWKNNLLHFLLIGFLLIGFKVHEIMRFYFQNTEPPFRRPRLILLLYLMNTSYQHNSILFLAKKKTCLCSRNISNSSVSTV